MGERGAGQRSIAGIDHIAVAVHDINLALPHYTDRLGLQLLHRETLPHVGTELAYLDGKNVLLQLVAPAGQGLITDYLRDHGEGLHHVCFAVDDIPVFLDAVGEDGEPLIFMGGRGRRACFLTTQSNGMLIELTETRVFEQHGTGAAADGPVAGEPA